MGTEISRAYFTLVENEPWVVGALVLGHSLRRTKTNAVLVCQIGPEVTDDSTRSLKNVYDIVEPAEKYAFPEGSINNFADVPRRLSFSFRRLNAWRRTEFQRITYIDSDVVVMKNIDDLFDVPGVAAPREVDFRVWMRGKTYTDFFNGGLVSFTPSEQIFRRFAEMLSSEWIYLGAAEQHLVNVVCRDDWFRIPDRYHVQAGTKYHAHFIQRPSAIRTVHFSKISKPWDEGYLGRMSLWRSWQGYAGMWLEKFRDYESKYSHAKLTPAFWWEKASASDVVLANRASNLTARKPASRNRVKLVRQTPRKLAEIAVFKGAFQKVSELGSLISILRRRKLRTVVEIGTFRGGTLWLWCQIATENARVVSIDMPVKAGIADRRQQAVLRKCAVGTQRLSLIRSDSQQEATRDRLVRSLAGETIDFLFIDGDHNYDAVQRDFELYSPLVRSGGVVAFHDILHHPNFPQIEVERYWNGVIKKAYHVRELVDLDDERGWGQWGGIGVVYIR